MISSKSFSLCITAVSLSFLPTVDAFWGKVDVGPAYVHLDVLESGITVQSLDMAAVRLDASLFPFDDYGLVIKPQITYGTAFDESHLVTGGIGVGQILPFSDLLYLTPSFGIIYTYTGTHIDITIPTPLGDLVFNDLKEEFRSVSPYFAIEALFMITCNTRFCFQWQYAWSRTHTRIEKFGKSKGNTEGPSFGGLIEYDVAEAWSVNLGAVYNTSLTQERHGLRGAGVKVGLAYWF